MKNNIILIGMSGVGKSYLGERIAKELNYNFFDIDFEIEKKTGMKIAGIFKEKGEKEFRKFEEEMVLKINELDNYVISTGGGVVESDNNLSALSDSGTIIFLDASKEYIVQNLEKASKDIRPLLSGNNLSEKINEMYKKRRPIYLNASNLVIKIDDLELNQLIERIKIFCKIKLVIN